MNRVLIFILATVCILGMFGCGSKDTVTETSDFDSNSIQNKDNGNPNMEKSWSEQDIMFMFS
ncbi:MAG: hypothetical protein PUB07_06565 [Clostridia bacterium]|nr:hypothetical protein [Clostridia bacterium]